jgi:hypothetical protein
MARFFLLLTAACAAAPSALDSASEELTRSIGPQSFIEGMAPGAFAFHGAKGDVIAPDLWPRAKSELLPALTLLGPKNASGQRGIIARGMPRGADPRHLAIDGFRLPETGSYLLVVGGAPAGPFTLRLWMQSSHLPRQETSQVDLTLTPSPAMLAAQKSHESAPRPWTDAEVDALVQGIEAAADLRVALSDAHLLLWLITPAHASAGALARARGAAAKLVGTPRQFHSLDPGLQSFALYRLDGLLFAGGDMPAPREIDDQIAQLVGAWPGAREDRASRLVQARTLDGAVYGWQARWTALQKDDDGREVWIDFATEWFDGKGGWLGEQSSGASEPDDD